MSIFYRLVKSTPARARGLGKLLVLFAAIGVFPLLLASSCDGGGGGGGGEIGSSSASGSLIVPERVVLDYDVNDPANPSAPNDGTTTAQPVPNLVFVAGYVGNTTDPDDYFKVSLNKGDQVVMLVGDTKTNPPDNLTVDLDLGLYLIDGNTVTLDDGSTSSTSQIETVTGSTTGDYYVKVNAFAESSIYRLALGVTATTAIFDAWSADDEFVPNQAVVQFKAPALETAMQVLGGTRPVGASGLRPAAAMMAARMGAVLQEVDPQGLALVSFDSSTGLKSLAWPTVTTADEKLLRARKATLDKIKELAANPDVEYAEPNFIYHPLAFPVDALPNDPYYGQMWGLAKIRAAQTWAAAGIGNDKVVIAIVDTGVLYDHPDLTGNILRDGSTVVGYDLISLLDIAVDGNGIDPDPYDVGDRRPGLDPRSSFHGSHCAGTAAAATNNSKGIAGVAGGARIMPVRVLGKGGGTNYDIAQGVLYAAGLPNASGQVPKVLGVITPADIISMSLGGTSNTSALKNAINSARGQGCIIIAAAGNDSTSALFYPAAYPGVVGVSAVDYAGSRAYYSNYGSYVDIAAPGGDTGADLNHDGIYDGILSTIGNDSSCPTMYKPPPYNPKDCIQKTYALYQGTSMAAPHVAGVVALMISAIKNVDPAKTLTPQNLDDLIAGTIDSDTVTSITNYPKAYRDNNLGYGIIDAEKAVNAALAINGMTFDTTPHLYLSPDQLSFGFSISRLTTSIANRGVEDLGAITVEPYAETWLLHTLAGDSLIFDVDRGNSVENGTYQATVTVSSAYGGIDSVQISMNVGDQVGSNVGIVYILLVDPDTLMSLYQVTTDFEHGYAYKFADIKAGKYLLGAGTDLDNDWILGDNGELFGIYPSLEQPTLIDVKDGQDLTQRDFPLQFVGLPVSSAAAGGNALEPGKTLLRIE